VRLQLRPHCSPVTSLYQTLSDLVGSFLLVDTTYACAGFCRRGYALVTNSWDDRCGSRLPLAGIWRSLQKRYEGGGMRLGLAVTGRLPLTERRWCHAVKGMRIASGREREARRVAQGGKEGSARMQVDLLQLEWWDSVKAASELIEAVAPRPPRSPSSVLSLPNAGRDKREKAGRGPTSASLASEVGTSCSGRPFSPT
jgi:hypothetical protein